MKFLRLLGIAISLALVVGCGTTKSHESFARPPIKCSKASAEILIISAVYGSGTHFADVTYRVDEILREPDVEFFARPEWLHADPTPGWNKALVIVYEFKGERRIFTTGEGGRVSMERLMKSHERQKRRRKK